MYVDAKSVERNDRLCENLLHVLRHAQDERLNASIITILFRSW